MLNVAVLTILFSITSVISVILIGGRNLIGGEMSFLNILKIIFDWHFIVGAIFAFLSRLLFMIINSAIYKIPELSTSSTTITTFITSVSLIFIAVANYYFLQERFTFTQSMGAFIILFGIFLMTIK